MIYIKDLPKIYQNKIYNINNNKDIFYDKMENNLNNDRKPLEQLDINNKIINLFKNSNSVYKVKVDIRLKSGEIVTKYMIGRLPGKIVTLDNEVIFLENIKDINLSK